MRRFGRVLILAALASVSITGVARSIIRINGNQLLEGAGEYGGIQRTPANAAAAPRIVSNVGQGVIARGDIPDSLQGTGDYVSLAIVVGLGGDIAHVVYETFNYCPVGQTGDVDQNGSINAADLIRVIQFLYKGGPTLEPCTAAGDVNCSGEVTAADCVVLTNFVFLGGAPPCDVCSLFGNGTWSCPQ